MHTGLTGMKIIRAAFTTFTSNTFGQIRNSLDPRIMQFALKNIF